MKKLALAMILALGTQASLTRTVILDTTTPSVDSLREATKLLRDATKAKMHGDERRVRYLLSQARERQQFQTIETVYNAAFIVIDKGQRVNYLQVLDRDTDSDLRYRRQITDGCYVGNVYEANRLLSKAIEKDHLNYDEEWYENNRIMGQMIIVDLVDGPGDYSNRQIIKPCF